ncbi:hypothetical protein [Dyella sp. 2HG41-7]|uniref:hypothetical protein n=1 Tax=Dyella sp. 2HG41-7 TaxID=2883239 RepID=UPI001F282D03|nr:hypothetical protein [Dyella sp. 2HG41-7]
MMLSFRRRPAQKPIAKDPSAATAESTPDKVDIQVRHLDYDRQPLRVDSLSHYNGTLFEDERFHVH